LHTRFEHWIETITKAAAVPFHCAGTADPLKGTTARKRSISECQPDQYRWPEGSAYLKGPQDSFEKGKIHP
jgi:hypothetical protein